MDIGDRAATYVIRERRNVSAIFFDRSRASFFDYEMLPELFKERVCYCTSFHFDLPPSEYTMILLEKHEITEL